MLSPRDQIVESIEIGRKADRNPRNGARDNDLVTHVIPSFPRRLDRARNSPPGYAKGLFFLSHGKARRIAVNIAKLPELWASHEPTISGYERRERHDYQTPGWVTEVVTGDDFPTIKSRGNSDESISAHDRTRSDCDFDELRFRT